MNMLILAETFNGNQDFEYENDDSSLDIQPKSRSLIENVDLG